MLLASAACGRSCADEGRRGGSDAALVDVAAPPAKLVDASADVPERDAATGLTPEQRRTYWEALLEGRKRTLAKQYEAAIGSFTRALEVVPADPRAESERGYARYLNGDNLRAKADFEQASAACDPKDKKLAAQIEFNLGLVCDALADSGIDDQLRGAAVGHYRRANQLSPSKAAAAKMGGCPGAWGPVTIATFPSLADAEAKGDAGGDPWQPLEGAPGVFTRAEDTTTTVLLPIAAGRYAHVDVGLTTLWHCGTLGEVQAVKLGGAWKVTYQAHAGVMGPGLCFCEDGDVCDAPGGLQSGSPKCKCAEPICPMSCGPANVDAGEHEETYLDEKTGAGIWRVQISHEFLKDIKVDVDLAARRFHATGLGCIADIALPK